METTKSQLAENRSNQAEELETRLIEQKTIHQTGITRIKSDCLESLEKPTDDLRLKYEERIHTLEGRISTHSKHYDNWGNQIRALETKQEKLKGYKTCIETLSRDRITLTTREVSFEKLLQLGNAKCKFLSLSATKAGKREAKERAKAEEYNNDLNATKS